MGIIAHCVVGSSVCLSVCGFYLVTLGSEYSFVNDETGLLAASKESIHEWLASKLYLLGLGYLSDTLTQQSLWFYSNSSSPGDGANVVISGGESVRDQGGREERSL